MKITPLGKDQIKVETDKGSFYVFSLVGGGLEIRSQDGKTITYRPLTGCAVIGARAIVIKEE